ncbi:MAG: hypothetical protein GXY61_12735, partial [Lentisphaerae bacterium]|nr:hypothetical protein [Lentisphaerota bacterium]
MNGFDVFPKVVPANKVSEIRIRPRYKYLALHAEDDISVKYFPYAGLWSDAAKASLEDASKDTTLSKDVWRLENGELIIQMEFAAEQEHRFVVCLASPTVRRPTSEFSAVVYSVDPDLYALRPFRGDFHLHTIGSDGKEDCLYMAARCREIGMDFAAISDHRRMEPSLEAIDYWRKYDLDFKLYPGEEVHAPDNHVHVINFGASRSVNQMYRDDEA